ncbi:MAG: LysR family transcriptional regulator [Rhodospirillaceae bacterium]|nr:LysR family transcriptional regulator [Rhodospirillaceae bacterium]
MDQRKLEHFLAVIEHGQFNLAAAANGVSQQAISKAIAKLETELDVKLFERNALGATPTIYAKALEGRAQSILAETRLATAELNALSGAVLGTLNIGVGLAAARRIVPKAIHAFRAQRPGIGISATVEPATTLYGKLLRGELDLVISPLPDGASVDPQIETTPLFTDTDRPMVGGKHPLAVAKRVTMADLAVHTWIAPRYNAAIWFEICHAFAAARLAPPADVIRTDSMPLALGLLENENCIAMMGAETMTPEITAARIKVLEVPGLALKRQTHLATRRAAKLSPTAKAFVPFVQEMCRGRQSRGA